MQDQSILKLYQKYPLLCTDKKKKKLLGEMRKSFRTRDRRSKL